MKQWRPDIVHETYFSYNLTGPSTTPSVVTVHDMIHERFPNNFWFWDKTSANKRAAVDRASHIICISESTRRDLIQIFDVPPGKTSVIHLAYNKFEVQNDVFMNTPDTHTRPYLLYVGHRSGYKNFINFILAYGSSSILSSELDVVCFGGGPWTPKERSLISSFHLQDKIHLQSGDDNCLARAYLNAKAFVYPSIYEGFGLPTLEAMAHDCPVLCSNTSSLPEVVGDAGEYFDPNDIDSIRLAMERVLFESNRRHELITLGQQRLTHFSWQKCSAETMKVYEHVCMSSSLPA